jgi:hypothetical protein
LGRIPSNSAIAPQMMAHKTQENCTVLSKEGWRFVPIAEKLEDEAKAIRVIRDQQYGNIYKEAPSDARWMGDLGEIVFNKWLLHNHVEGFKWIQHETAGKPDFRLKNGTRIGVKLVKRTVPPQLEYGIQISAAHSHEAVDHFFFTMYEFKKRTMWLLGGIDRNEFLATARYYKEGKWVHPHYQVRDHDIYNNEISRLQRPDEWIASRLISDTDFNPSETMKQD